MLLANSCHLFCMHFVTTCWQSSVIYCCIENESFSYVLVAVNISSEYMTCQHEHFHYGHKTTSLMTCSISVADSPPTEVAREM